MREEQANMSTQVTDVSNVSEVEVEAEIQMLSVGERRETLRSFVPGIASSRAAGADFIMMRSTCTGNLL